MTEEQIIQKAREKYCNGCNRKIEQCVWAWRNVNGKTKPNEENCGCSEVPAYIAGATEATKELQEENAELKKRNGELAGQKASLERWFGEAKSIIREYIRLSLQEDKDIDANVKLFQKAESFFEGAKL